MKSFTPKVMSTNTDMDACIHAQYKYMNSMNIIYIYKYIHVTLHCYFNLHVWSCMFRTPYNLYIPILVSMQYALQKLYFHIGPVMMRNVLRWIFDVWLTVDSWCVPALLHIHDMWSITRKTVHAPDTIMEMEHDHIFPIPNLTRVSLGFWEFPADTSSTI